MQKETLILLLNQSSLFFFHHIKPIYYIYVNLYLTLSVNHIFEKNIIKKRNYNNLLLAEY